MNASDKCQTSGLENLPDDNHENLNYIIERPVTSIDYKHLFNGECSFWIDVYLDNIGNLQPIEDAGLVSILPVFEINPSMLPI